VELTLLVTAKYTKSHLLLSVRMLFKLEYTLSYNSCMLVVERVCSASNTGTIDELRVNFSCMLVAVDIQH
jgi:hypothetical protein